jgi:uncharacterized protein YgbK (DUF1537 family)
MRTDSRASIGILADDLTSAADGAGPFVAGGLRAWIGRGGLPAADSAVVAIDAGSRSMSPGEAAERIAIHASQLAGRDILFKTVDSTLRGHVRVELEAAFRASGRGRLVLAPAFPAAGRTTLGGVQFVDGAPVSETVYGRDPAHPARTSVIAELVAPAIGDAVILDAATQDELDSQIAALPDPKDILWAGSPGMALALARRVAPPSAPVTRLDAAAGEILVVIGTANPCSRRQAQQIGRTPGVTILSSPSVRRDDPAVVLRGIADAAAGKVRQASVQAVIATGGDTMDALLDRLEVRGFEVLGEFEPGFPVARAALNGRALLIAMKAGGFGDEFALSRAIESLRQASLPQPGAAQ